MASQGIRAVQDALEGAIEAPKLAPRRRRNGAADEKDQRELPLLPAGCPVTPLGKLKQLCFYLDEAGQLIDLGPRDHGKTHIQSLFGRQAALVHEYWPRYGATDNKTGEPKITGWMPEKAAEVLQAACAHEGLFDPQGRVRGRGAWAGETGELILHCGDKIYRPAMPVGEGWQDPGKIDGFVYPSAAAMPRPDPEPVTVAAGYDLLALLGCWYWERPAIDPYLLLGFIAAAPFGGAIDWRPHVWVTGDTSTGKSTLERKLLAWLFEAASLRTHEATEAALRQVLGKQTLPVFFDELEAEANDDRAQRVIKLARLASSAGVIFRGGADHQASEFIARSCFYFTSILMPAMLSQDRNRLAILEMKAIPEGTAEPPLDRGEILALGRRLRRRVIGQWPRYPETLAAYRQALAKTGHRGRSQDQFGTLLAFADLLLYDAAPGPDRRAEEEGGDALAHWGEALRAADFAETADNESDSAQACAFLAGTMLQLRGGDEPRPLSRFIAKALGRDGALDSDVDQARRQLENHGLRIVTAVAPKAEGKAWGAKEPGPDDPVYLAIANAHEALARMFREQRWAGGVWSQTFGRVPGAIRRVQVRFAHFSRKATLVPIAALLDAEDVGSVRFGATQQHD